MGEIVLGVLIGAGLFAIGKKNYRVALKEGIKLGITTAEALKQAAHEGHEQLNDVIAEARHEIEVARRAAQTDLDAGRAPIAD
jgi:hypothetical protein